MWFEGKDPMKQQDLLFDSAQSVQISSQVSLICIG